MRWLITLLVAIFLPWFVRPLLMVEAQTLNSDSYTIRLGNFNVTSGLKSSASYSLSDTMGQIAANFFASNGYHIKAGFQYIYTLYDFSFTISSLLVDLGNLIPNTFSAASSTLTVTAPGQGYTVTAHALTPLSSGTHVVAGVSPGVWTSPQTYGFGYSLTGNDLAPEFTTPSYFRPFPVLSASSSPDIIMTSTQAGKNRTAELTYKVNVGPDQAPGAYSTQIVYIATPVY